MQVRSEKWYEAGSVIKRKETFTCTVRVWKNNKRGLDRKKDGLEGEEERDIDKGRREEAKQE